MPDYSKCIIYTIRTPTGLYVGSTCNFTNRKYQHKSNIHNDKKHSFNYKLYKNIRENNDDWEMKPYSVFPCKNKMEMTVEEERVRREFNADLNMISCNGDKDEYMKIYRDCNKEKIANKHKQYLKKNKEQIANKHKQWVENNKEKRAEYMKEYNKKYREKKKAEQIN